MEKTQQDKTKLARQLLALGNQLLNLAGTIVSDDDLSNKSASNERISDKDSFHWVGIAEELYRDRQKRRSTFSADLFGEPAWDMMLDLYVAEKRCQQVSVTSACIGSQVPTTTALRCIVKLEQYGLIERIQDQADARRLFVRLTIDGYTKMTEYLAGIRTFLLAENENDGSKQMRTAKDRTMESLLIVDTL